MRQIDLREYESRAIPLSGAELAALQEYRQELGLDIAPGTASGSWVLKPGSTVGALEIGDLLEVVIRPKLQIGRVLFLASYALGAFRLRDIERFHFAEDSSAVEALARFFAAASRRAFRRGLLRGYRSREEALTTVRGRIRFDEQIRRRFAIPLPVEVRYDEFTEDVRGNRLVRAALHRLHAMHIADMGLRGELLRTEAVLAEVTLREYAAHAVPEVAFDRLNEHYREVLGLARLILRHGTVKTDHGTIRAAGFLMDMNQVFERFVRRALREQLALTRRAFPAPDDMPRLFLDQDRKIRLEPDLSWWRNGTTCRFVGDAKYKALGSAHAPNADLYQLLAYATALRLPGGLLIYASGEADPTVHYIEHAGKRLEVAALDLAASPPALLGQIRELAERIRGAAAAVRAHAA